MALNAGNPETVREKKGYQLSVNKKKKKKEFVPTLNIGRRSIDLMCDFLRLLCLLRLL
jgi:hypothetical protein